MKLKISDMLREETKEEYEREHPFEYGHRTIEDFEVLVRGIPVLVDLDVELYRETPEHSNIVEGAYWRLSDKNEWDIIQKKLKYNPTEYEIFARDINKAINEKLDNVNIDDYFSDEDDFVVPDEYEY